jgi:hypothetical protein
MNVDDEWLPTIASNSGGSGFDPRTHARLLFDLFCHGVLQFLQTNVRI